MGPVTLHIDHSGEWMSADDLQAAAMAASGQNRDVIVDLGSLHHLDASALQILLALDREQKQRGHKLELVHASPQMREWFAYAGAGEHFWHDAPVGQ